MFRMLREEVPPSSFQNKIYKRESNPCVRLTDGVDLPLTYESYAVQRDGSEL